MSWQVGQLSNVDALFGLVMAVLGIVLSWLILWFAATRIFKLRDKSLITPLKISTISGIAGYLMYLIVNVFYPIGGPTLFLYSLFVLIATRFSTWRTFAEGFSDGRDIIHVLSLIIVIALTIWLIKKKYELQWKKASLIWATAFLPVLLIKLVIFVIFMSNLP